MMIHTFSYLMSGNTKQRGAYHAIIGLGVMEDLQEFMPVLCGTVPIEIDIEGSDLDIIMEVQNSDVSQPSRRYLV